MFMTDTFCSFTRNFIFKSCFLLSMYGRIVVAVLTVKCSKKKKEVIVIKVAFKVTVLSFKPEIRLHAN